MRKVATTNIEMAYIVVSMVSLGLIRYTATLSSIHAAMLYSIRHAYMTITVEQSEFSYGTPRFLGCNKYFARLPG